MSRQLLFLCVFAAGFLRAVTAQDQAVGLGRLTSDTLAGLELRSIGPTLSTGRVADIEIDPKNPSVWYVASAFGGLWKTLNRGITFTRSSKKTPRSRCAVLSWTRRNPCRLMGTGETKPRSAHSRSVYKSIDAARLEKRRPAA